MHPIILLDGKLQNKMLSFKKTHGIDITGGEFEPWITRDAINLLTTLIKKDFVGLEWGSGSSTIWFADKLKFLYTIEHDVEWGNFCKKHIDDNRPDFINKWKFYALKKMSLHQETGFFLIAMASAEKSIL